MYVIEKQINGFIITTILIFISIFNRLQKRKEVIATAYDIIPL